MAKPFIILKLTSFMNSVPIDDEDFGNCDKCKKPLEQCICVCPFCGERDKCECGIKLSNDDGAATGG